MTTKIAARTRRAATLTAALGVASALLTLAAPPATAAQPTATLQPGQDQIYSTAFWGETKFCATNTSRSVARMYVVNWGGTGSGPTIDVPANSVRCHSGWYWAVPAKVRNIGTVPFAVTVTP